MTAVLLSYLMGGVNKLLDDCLAVWLQRTGDDDKSSKGELLFQTLSRELLCTRLYVKVQEITF
jgi:hypothetical protein